MTLIQRTVLKQYYETLKCAIRSLNLFESKSGASTNEHERKNELISTRLFIILLIISFLILCVYSSLIIVQKTVTISSPSLNQYRKLEKKYSQTLSCACSNISISYSKFVSITPRYNEVCQSKFISTDWIDFIKLPQVSSRFEMSDLYDLYGLPAPRSAFGFLVSYYFKMLAILCTLANETIYNALNEAGATQLITLTVQTEYNIETESQAFVKDVKSATETSFATSLDITRNVAQSNQLASALQTNYRYGFFEDLRFIPDTITHIRRDELDHVTSNNFYNVCNCESTVGCYTDILDQYDVPGFYLGCSILESLLLSDLRCLYDETCLDDFQMQLRNVSDNITVLKSSTASKFSPNTTVGNLVRNLMAENWKKNISFKLYYEQCAPSYCVYTYRQKFDVLYIVTTIIALIGGLTKGLQIIIPRVVNLLKRKRKTKVLPFTSSDVSISYRQFINIQPIYHHVCSSDFVTQDWFDILEPYFDILNMPDLSRYGSPIFQALASMCTVSNGTVQNALGTFGSTNYVNNEVQSPELFQTQIDSITSRFKSNTVNSFTLSLNMISKIMRSNALWSGLQTNFNASFRTMNDNSLVYFPTVYNGNCSCSLRSDCRQELGILQLHFIGLSLSNITYTTLIPIPNIYVGCTIIDGLMESNLQAFYNASWVYDLWYYFNNSRNSKIN
ncbi:unnamed protein product [Didymodactylos carnosus]|uniref:Uncharacterized protein n=1 Tax=Didymodactylos carnosus TaxID=1234261 RepID=A0A815GE11_9BILA